MASQRYLIIADLHCRSIWKNIVAKEGDNCDKIVFLGDYTCPKEVKLDDPTDACGILYEILDFKDKNPDKVVLLRGNHDLASLGYHWAQCYPQDHPKVCQYWQTEDVKNWFLKNTQWVYQFSEKFENIVCSHAGLSDKFIDNVQKYLKIHMNLEFPYPDCSSYRTMLSFWVLEHINQIPPCELFAFTPCKFSDYNGESATQPCTWIRPYTLLQYGAKCFTHIVGHTPTKNICNIKDECISARSKYYIEENEEIVNNYCNVWCCDNLANGEYLIFEDGKFKVCKI